MAARNGLRAARELARMTQAHLAGAAGVSERTVIRAEQGRPVSAESEMALCAVLGLRPADLAARPAPAFASIPDSPAGCIASMGETPAWIARPDPATWRAANAFGAWAVLGIVLAVAYAVSAVLTARVAMDAPDLAPRALAYSATGLAALAYLGLRARRYADLDREVRATTYAMTGDALWVIREAPDGSRSMHRMPIPRTGVPAPGPRPAYRLWPRVRDVVVDLPAGPVRLHGLADVPA